MNLEEISKYDELGYQNRMENWDLIKSWVISFFFKQSITVRNTKKSARKLKVPPGVEPRSLDSKSRVLTTTPWNHLTVKKSYIKILQIDIIHM